MRMRRAALILLSIICMSYCSNAQHMSATASQRILLQLNPVIEFSSTINTSVNQPELKISSNSNFIINAEKATFTCTDNQLITCTKDILKNISSGDNKVFAIKNATPSKKTADGDAEMVVYTVTAP